MNVKRVLWKTKTRVTVFFCGCGVTLWMTTGHAVNCRKMDIRDKLCL